LKLCVDNAEIRHRDQTACTVRRANKRDLVKLGGMATGLKWGRNLGRFLSSSRMKPTKRIQEAQVK